MRQFCLVAFVSLLMSTTSVFAYEGGNNYIASLLSSAELCVFLVLIPIVAIYFIWKSDKFSVAHGPEILTTIGILGCFLGIALALLDFDSNNITNSVPALLEGVKTAFWSSVAGIICALIVKFWHSFSDRIKESTAINTDNGLTSAIKDLRKTLAGEEDGSLLSQIKMFRQDSHDQQNKLQQSFDQFAQKMAEQNQKALIDALNDVIRDFNEKLTEQFGDNFKQLNMAVGQLVTWQQQYKDELEQIKNYQAQYVSEMEQVSQSFSVVLNQAQNFNQVAQDLHHLLDAMHKQKDVLFEQEKALCEVLSTMKDHIPDFSEKTKALISDISNGVSNVQTETAKVVSDYKAKMDSMHNTFNAAFSDGITATTKAIQNSIKESQSQIVEINKNHAAQLQSTNSELKTILIESIKSTQQELANGLHENSRVIKESVVALDKGLEKSLTDSLTSLGKQLAALSEKFVQDYLPLTERLREVVQLAKHIERV